MLRILTLVMVAVVLSAAPAAAVVIVDVEGERHELAQPARRIVSLYSAHTRNLLDLGLDQEIIAVGRSDGQLQDRPLVGLKDDPERLIALAPDLVLIRPMISRGYPRLVERLKQVGIEVISLQPRGMEELFEYWRTLGAIIDRTAEAEQMVERFQQGLAELDRQVARIPDTERKKVYFEAIHARMKTFAPDSIAAFVLRSAGGENVALDAPVVRQTNIAAYGKERLLAQGAKIDVFLAQQGRMNPIEQADILDEPGFQAIKAVQQRAVYLVPEHLVARPTMELLDGMRLIHELLYVKQQGAEQQP